MAAGIGGRTIREAKNRIDIDELRVWAQYRARGFLLTARTVDTAAAQVARAFAGGKLSDYMLLRDIEKPAANEPVTIPAAMAMLGGTIRKRGQVQ